MNKADLIDAIANETGLTKKDAKKVLDALLNNIIIALKKGKSVQLVGFGTFSVSKRTARTGRNPKTGTIIKISSKNIAKFKAGKLLIEEIIEGDDNDDETEFTGPKRK